MVLKNVRAKVDTAWTNTKKVLAVMSAWGLIFSLVTICKLGVAFDYDDTLVFSTPAFAKAFASVSQPFTPEFWAAVNHAYDIEQPKVVASSLAWMFRAFGFRVSVICSRPAVEGDALKKEWRRLVAQRDFIFAGDRSQKHLYLSNGNTMLYFGDSDSDILEARKAKVFPVRIRRSPKSSYKEDYHPGTMEEWVIPFSEY